MVKSGKNFENFQSLLCTGKYEEQEQYRNSTISDWLKYWTNVLMTFFSKRQKTKDYTY